MHKGTTLILILALQVFTNLRYAQLTIITPSAGITRENPVADGGSDGSLGPSLSFNKVSKESFIIIQNEGSLNIVAKDSGPDFQILNMNNQILATKSNSRSDVLFDVSGFQNRVYIVRATNGSSSYAIKVV